MMQKIAVKFSAGDFELSGDDEWFTLKRNYNSYSGSVTDIKSLNELRDLQYIVNCMVREMEKKLP